MTRRKTNKKEIYKTRSEWLKARGIGGSDAAIILGKSKWGTTKEIISRIRDGKCEEKKKNSRMIAGTNKEPLIRKMFYYNTNYKKLIEPPKRRYWLFRRTDEPLITCTPDGIIVDNNGNKIGLEIKDAALYRAEEISDWNNGILPDKYYIQLLHYLVTMDELIGVILYAHLMYYRKNDDTGKWEYDYSELKQFYVYREDVLNDIEYLRKKENR